MSYTTSGSSWGTSTARYDPPTQKCACGCGAPSYTRFCRGHSVQNRRKALKRMHLPLGGKAGKKLKKRKKKERAKKVLETAPGYWRIS